MTTGASHPNMSAQGPFAFFGATGGCANAALALALKAGYQCSARKSAVHKPARRTKRLIRIVARTPSKLTDMLTAKEVPEETLDNNLRIVQGDVLDLETVKKVFFFDNQPVLKVLSGIGMPPTLSTKKMDGTICESAGRMKLSIY